MCSGRLEGSLSIPPVRHPDSERLLDMVRTLVECGHSPAHIIPAVQRRFAQETQHLDRMVGVVDGEISEADAVAIVRALRRLKRRQSGTELGLA